MLSPGIHEELSVSRSYGIKLKKGVLTVGGLPEDVRRRLQLGD